MKKAIEGGLPPNVQALSEEAMNVMEKVLSSLPAGTTKEELRVAIEKAISEHEVLSHFASIEPDDSDAGFRVKMSFRLTPTSNSSQLN